MSAKTHAVNVPSYMDLVTCQKCNIQTSMVVMHRVEENIVNMESACFGCKHISYHKYDTNMITHLYYKNAEGKVITNDPLRGNRSIGELRE